MNGYVLDASVAAKWSLPRANEPYTEHAAALLNRYVRGEVRFVVPDLFWAELTNVFWKAIRQGRWSRSDAETAIRSAVQREIPTVSARTLIEDALEIAATFDRSVHDSLYLALAIASRMYFITADERLANALAAQLPVKWLPSLM
jgi:predicted nucleic acid-binding protein